VNFARRLELLKTVRVPVQNAPFPSTVKCGSRDILDLVQRLDENPSVLMLSSNFETLMTGPRIHSITIRNPAIKETEIALESVVYHHPQ
jgi:hypothetical protein